MKKHIAFAALTAFKNLHPGTKKKIKIFLAVAASLFFVFFVLIGIFLFKAAGFIWNQTQTLTTQIATVDTTKVVQTIQQKAEPLQGLQVSRCLEAAVSRLTPEHLLRKPLAVSFNEIKTICLQTSPETYHPKPTDSTTDKPEISY